MGCGFLTEAHFSLLVHTINFTLYGFALTVFVTRVVLVAQELEQATALHALLELVNSQPVYLSVQFSIASIVSSGSRISQRWFRESQTRSTSLLRRRRSSSCGRPSMPFRPPSGSPKTAHATPSTMVRRLPLACLTTVISWQELSRSASRWAWPVLLEKREDGGHA